MQDQKKQDKLIKKPQKFVPQEIAVQPTDSLENEIAALVNESESERFMRPLFDNRYDIPDRCRFGCSCGPCRQGFCGACEIDSQRRRQGF